jgi:Fe-S cluster assembly scaffold protein SufB
MQNGSLKLYNTYSKEIVVADERGALKQTFIVADDIPPRGDIRVRLVGRGSRVELTFIYIGRNVDASELNVTIVHEAPETYSRVTAKAALFDESRFSFRGMIEIHELAKGSDAYLLAKALLLSPKARAEVQPYLEIKTDEVKASHGSSVGRVDERQMFYLQSRGLPCVEAQKIILSGFLGPQHSNIL